MKKRLILSAGLILILLLLLCQAASAAQTDTPQPAKSAAEWASEGYTVIDLDSSAFGPDETDGKLVSGYFVLRKDINYLKQKPGSVNAVNGNSFTLSGFQTMQTGIGENAKMYCFQSGNRFYFGHVDTEANGAIVLKDMVSMNNCQYSPNVAPYTVGAWIDWRLEFKAEIPGVPFFGDGYFQILLDHHSVDPGAWEPTEHTIEYYNGIHFDRIGVKAEDETTEDYDVGLFSFKHAVGVARLELSLIEFWGELSFDADALMGVEVLFKSYGPVFWDWSAIPHPKNGLTINKVSRANSHGGLELSINVGPKVSAEWMLIQDLELDVSLLGVYMTGSNYGHGYSLIGDGEYKWHVCVDCFQEKLTSVIGPLKCILDLVGFDPVDLIDIDPEDLEQFYQFYYSVDHEECGEGDCPYWAYPTHVYVTNQRDSKPLSAVEVSFRPHPWDCSPYDKGTTGSDGKVDLYMKPGEDYYVTAELESPLDPDWVISKERMMRKGETADTFDIALDIPEKTVFFKNTGSGEPADWPDDINFMPFFSKDVTLPNNVPTVSGRKFTGWNTKEDGSGKTYAPGTKLTLDDDLTLWAQWELAENSWVVVYNANGGTKAPGPQIVKQGKDAVLSNELPEAGKMIFKGWTPDLQAMDPIYQPGATLPYDKNKNVVVLYAIWDLSPVPEPIHIAFNANGGKHASLPRDIWMEQGSWVQLKHAVPPVGSTFTFLGWSENPLAKEPEFLAGHSYYFYKSTTLYAIWEELDTVTLVFKDSLPGEASGIPSPIIITPAMSRYVRIPSTIPQKGGRVFTGWNTQQDGSGTKYAPGAVITLLKDVTLWAQWELTGDSWLVVYDANGGTKAPHAQIVPKGKDAVLSDEPATSETMTFMGWATKRKATQAEYQPGDTLPYDKNKNYVILYALWELEPVKRPVVISFDVNGGLPGTEPEEISAPQGVWTKLPDKIPSWDGQHTFQGWSTDPRAKAPQWEAGEAVIFEQDTTLYAVWKVHYTVISGAGSTWHQHSIKTQRFIADGNIMYFTELLIDGKRFENGVEITSGSTIADIKPWAMEQLSAGTHTVTFVYEDGEASAFFYVKRRLPPTGDTGHPALWLILVLSGTAGLALWGRKSYIARKKK